MKAGAEQGLTPSDVVLAADITFSCVADPQAAKEVSSLKLFAVDHINSVNESMIKLSLEN